MGLTGITSTARTLAYYTRLQEITANNLANTQTDGFKADRLTAWLAPGSQAPVPVQRVDLSQGILRDTGRPLDIALDGTGFLVVGTHDGERLVRGGSLRLDAAGRLTDPHGNPVLGTEGPIVIQGAAVEVQADGSVLVDSALVGRLRLVDADGPDGLSKEGMGRFRATGTLRAAPDTTQVRQGAIEEPNADPMLSMVDMVTIQRAYAANVDVLRAMDSVLATVTSDIGRS